REQAQASVAELLRDPLVDLAEVVEVEQDRRSERAPFRRDASAHRVLALQRRVEMAAVVQSGQRVANRGIGRLLVQVRVREREADLAREEPGDLLLLRRERP